MSLQMLERALIAYVNTKGDSNLFDKNNPNIISGYIDGSNLYITPQPTARLVWIEIEPNTTYTVTKLPQNRVCALSSTEPKLNEKVAVRYYVDTNLGGTTAEFAITSGSNHMYLIVGILATSANAYTEQEMIDSIYIKKVG